jgi:hypothetical protein
VPHSRLMSATMSAQYAHKVLRLQSTALRHGRDRQTPRERHRPLYTSGLHLYVELFCCKHIVQDLCPQQCLPNVCIECSIHISQLSATDAATKRLATGTERSILVVYILLSSCFALSTSLKTGVYNNVCPTCATNTSFTFRNPPPRTRPSNAPQTTQNALC